MAPPPFVSWASGFRLEIWVSSGEKRDGPRVTTFFFFFFFFFGDYLILGRKNLWVSDFGRKITLNFGEDLFFFFFLEITWFWAEKPFEFPSFPRHFASSFGQTVWNWFKINENSSQGRLHTSHSFKIAPPFQNPAYATGSRCVRKTLHSNRNFNNFLRK